MMEQGSEVKEFSSHLTFCTGGEIFEHEDSMRVKIMEVDSASHRNSGIERDFKTIVHVCWVDTCTAAMPA
jgi:hypothetical protein